MFQTFTIWNKLYICIFFMILSISLIKVIDIIVFCICFIFNVRNIITLNEKIVMFVMVFNIFKI